MQVGMTTLVSGPRDAAFVRDAERLGVTSVWVPETWGQDALTPLARDQRGHPYLHARALRWRHGGRFTPGQ